MCGLAGFLGYGGLDAMQAADALKRMAGAIAHRGPDSDGFWQDDRFGIGLAHRRLAIVDLTESGAQPMSSHCGRFVIAFNGEIYNHLKLRRDLEAACAAPPWRGHSDTETILALVSRFGIAAALSRLVGMFAIALWDREARTLTLARDRMGEKPLYYGRLSSGELLFGSELTALRAHPKWHGQIDRSALAGYMRTGAIPGTHSIFQNFSKLTPGRWIEFDLNGVTRTEAYWDLRNQAERLQGTGADRSDAEAIDALESVLGEAVASQMMADVPLGAFLSGGVDSSTIVALMCKQGDRQVRTFSIGFDEPGYNEAEHAKAVARHLGTRHTELYVSSADALQVVDKLGAMYDEPFADSSQIPTYLVSRMARQHVTVALSGDAGDELFAGYNRHLIAATLWNRVSKFPLPLRRLAARALISMSPAALDSIAGPFVGLLPKKSRPGNVGDKVHKFATSVMSVASKTDMYRALVSQWSDPESVVLRAKEPSSMLDIPGLGAGMTDVERICLLDQLTYLPDDILAKVDRAAMAVSLETRVPLLDYRVVEFAWTVPLHQKVRDGQGKWLLRQLLYKHVPRELIERPKQGFAIPLEQWLRGPLRDWAEDLLSEPSLRAGGHFDAAIVREKWRQHLSGARNWQHQIWNVLMFQSWLAQSVSAR